MSADYAQHGPPCPKCRKGSQVEDSIGWHCSRRYEHNPRKRCDWESGLQGERPTTDGGSDG